MPSARTKILSYLPLEAYVAMKYTYFYLIHNARFRADQSMRFVDTGTGYSFKQFDDTGSIFVHIPKCAGVSVNRALYGNLGGGHRRIEDYYSVFTPLKIKRYFKFTVVRNPWDRVVSAYFFLKKGGYNQRDQQFFGRELSKFVDFDDFVSGWLNRSNIWKYVHFRPQYNYLIDNRGKVGVDFIARLESLEEDFEIIAQSVCQGARLPRLNKSQRLRYRDYYDEKARRIVAEVYREDIELLGYEF